MERLPLARLRRELAAFALLLTAALLPPPAAAAAADCGSPQQRDDGWRIQADSAAAGFGPGALCEAMRLFAGSPRNLHALVVERHGKLVAEAYRAGQDRSTYALWSTRSQFGPEVFHDMRSVTKSVVALLWGIARAEGVVPPVRTPVLDLLPELADLRQGGRERITVAHLLCMRSGLAWDESGGYRRWDNDERPCSGGAIAHAMSCSGR